MSNLKDNDSEKEEKDVISKQHVNHLKSKKEKIKQKKSDGKDTIGIRK